ncbi:MAG: hypothetical protein Q4G43_09890 [Mobilicoccus sp.]|nr:hypothetical protein [Mobilicoccus sp.]
MSTWIWRCEDGSGAPLQTDANPTGFPSQAEAEAWLSEGWEDLADAGVEQVTLCEGDREVYGPMSLSGA